MPSAARYLLVIFAVVISGHYLLSLTHDGANATFVILARNSDLDNTVRSVREVEDRFNTRHHYPFVLLNDEPFTDEFKRRVSAVASGSVEYGLVPRDHWVQPDWIDEDKATKGREQLVSENVIYGGIFARCIRGHFYETITRAGAKDASMRDPAKACSAHTALPPLWRFWSLANFAFAYSLFFQLLLQTPLVQKYRWYWRIEPDVHFHCDVNFDPFLFMQDRGKVYGFTITMYEFDKTIPSLWGHVKDFIKLHPEHVAKDNAMGFMSDDGGRDVLVRVNDYSVLWRIYDEISALRCITCMELHGKYIRYLQIPIQLAGITRN
ncbi:nucleotide-diphospho-sugar transferase [Mycena polygramma]|nr:nucleotide-diphospho-sugar transferase [Mycena polygramma]